MNVLKVICLEIIAFIMQDSSVFVAIKGQSIRSRCPSLLTYPW